MFRINSKDISRTTQMFTETLLGKTEKNYVTRPFDVMQRLLNDFTLHENRDLNVTKCVPNLKLFGTYE
jgi:transcription initiation factor TFIIB